MKREQLEPIAEAIGAGDTEHALQLVCAAIGRGLSVGWNRELCKLADFLIDGKPRFTIFTKGNSKLPYLSYSELPAVTCSGAGECLDFCYSYKAWRYPAAFCRQAQNTVLSQTPEGRQHLLADLDANLERWARRAKPNTKLDLRLYVDGDFASASHVAFWMGALIARPELQAYGYSKSFSELLAYDMEYSAWPSNYRLNMSSGHRFMEDGTVTRLVRALPITRGDFIATATGDHKAYRAETGRKAFPCPGKCGECRTVKGENRHACGDSAMQGIDIIIAVH